MKFRFLAFIAITLICFVSLQAPPLHAGSGDGSAISFRNFTALHSEDTTFETDGAFTLEIWFRTTKTNGLFLFGHEDPGLSLNYAQLRVNSGNPTLRFVVGDQSGNTAAVDSPTALNDGQWHHAAGVRDGGMMQLYIDGQLVTETTGNDTVADLNINGPVKIGRWRFGSGTTLTEVDEARIWHTVRTAAEIADNRYGSVPINATGLVGYWPMAAGSGTTVVDATGNGNDLMFFNAGSSSPLWAGRAWAGGESAFDSAIAGGVGVNASAIITEDGDDVTLFPNQIAFDVTMVDLPAEILSRWSRYYLLTVNDVTRSGRGGGLIDVTFDISDAGGMGTFDASETYSLLRRNGEFSGGAFAVVPTQNVVVNGDRVTFTVDPGNFGSGIQQITIGTDMDTLAVGLSSQPSASGGQPLGLGTLLLIVTGLSGVVWFRGGRKLVNG